MMEKDRELKSTRRRDFLRVAGLGTLAGATAVAAGAPQTADATTPAQGRKPGYRETEHVRKFYRLARF